jgi:hypothetical protein
MPNWYRPTSHVRLTPIDRVILNLRVKAFPHDRKGYFELLNEFIDKRNKRVGLLGIKYERQ